MSSSSWPEWGWPGKFSFPMGTPKSPPSRRPPSNRQRLADLLFARDARVQGNTAHVLVDSQRVPQRRESTLLAIGALAQSASYPHRNETVGVVQIEPVRIHQLARARHGTTEADRMDTRLGVKAVTVGLNSARNAEVSGAVGHSRKLNANHSGRGEGGEDVPAWTGAAESGHGNARRAEALGDVARHVDAHHVKRNALGARPSQGGDPVRGLFETHPEAPANHVEIVTLLLRRLQNRLIGHEHRRREVVGESRAGQ